MVWHSRNQVVKLVIGILGMGLGIGAICLALGCDRVFSSGLFHGSDHPDRLCIAITVALGFAVTLAGYDFRLSSSPPLTGPPFRTFRIWHSVFHGPFVWIHSY